MHAAVEPVHPRIGICMIPQVQSTSVFDSLTVSLARTRRRASWRSARCAECAVRMARPRRAGWAMRGHRILKTMQRKPLRQGPNEPNVGSWVGETKK